MNNLSFQLAYTTAKDIEEGIERSLDNPGTYMNRRKTERAMLDVVCSGNPVLLEEYIQQNLRQLDQIGIGIMSREELKQQRYLCIVIVALICRAVIDAGVPEHIAYALGDSFIQKADNMQRPEQFIELTGKVMQVYCLTVQDYQMTNASGPVRKCCEYMMVRLHSNITLDELSEVCHLSPHYISDLFRRELGISTLQYFRQQKIRYARHMVLFSDEPIANISSLLSYPSQSNFTEQFKRAYGMTPLQYRNRGFLSQ